MSKFARVFELENDEQMVLMVKYNAETDKFDIAICTDVDDAFIELTIGNISTREKAIDIMNAYTIEKLIALRNEFSE